MLIFYKNLESFHRTLTKIDFIVLLNCVFVHNIYILNDCYRSPIAFRWILRDSIVWIKIFINFVNNTVI